MNIDYKALIEKAKISHLKPAPPYPASGTASEQADYLVEQVIAPSFGRAVDALKADGQIAVIDSNGSGHDRTVELTIRKPSGSPGANFDHKLVVSFQWNNGKLRVNIGIVIPFRRDDRQKWGVDPSDVSVAFRVAFTELFEGYFSTL
ncbi:MAG: hypothetical protein IPK81_14040 [Rhodospirillales bacterium]|nr:MAG: hypothetical protein IPK81_14040 [Rhodospirillales bacterium]